MTDLMKKHILVTGGTDGIGKAAVVEFAKRGARITLIGRNKEKTEQVIHEISTATHNDQIDYELCDLSRLADVKRMALNFKTKYDRLDLLVNNAGATFKKPLLGPDGYELTFTLNHLSHFLLTTTLLDLIRGTSDARVISTSSSMQARGKIDLDNIAYNTNNSGPTAYAASKLANILFTKELQNRLAGTNAVANCFEPGMVRTQFGGFGSDQGVFLNLVYALAKPFAVTAEKGADSLVWLATASEAGLLKGQYISKRKPTQPSKQAQDEQLASALWQLSEQLCKQVK